MIFKLAYNNIRKSYHIYLVYLFTLSLTIALFYGFTSIGTSQAIMTVSAAGKQYTDTFISIVNVTSYFVSFFVLFLMMYASDFFFKVRSQEYFVYKTLGINGADILKLMLSENLIIGAISTVFGLIMGIGINQLLNQVLIKYLMLDSKFSLTLDGGSIEKTVVYFMIILGIISFINARRINKKSIIELKNIQTEVVKKSISLWVAAVIGLVAIATLAISYASGYYSNMNPRQPLFYVSIICGSLGTLLFYLAVINIKNTRFKASKVKDKAFERSIFNNRLMKNKVSISIVSVSFVIILTSIFASNAIIAMVSDGADIPKFDAIVQIYGDKVKDSSKLKSEGYDFKNSAEVEDLEIEQKINNLTYRLKIISQSDFQQMASITNVKLDLTGDYNYISGDDYEAWIPGGDDTSSTINNRDLVQKISKAQSISINTVDSDAVREYTPNGLLIISDNQFSNFKSTFGNEISSEYGTDWYINFANDEEKQLMAKLESQVNESNKQGANSDEFYFPLVKTSVINSTLLFEVTILFISLYISFFIVIVSLAVLAIQQVMDAIEAKEEYKKIRLLGYNDTDIRKIVRSNTNKYFTCPLILGVINSIAALAVLNSYIVSMKKDSILSLQYNQNTLSICVILVIIYIVYIQLVKKIYYRIIEV